MTLRNKDTNHFTQVDEEQSRDDFTECVGWRSRSVDSDMVPSSTGHLHFAIGSVSSNHGGMRDAVVVVVLLGWEASVSPFETPSPATSLP
jgi:hypothetical protein